MPAHLVSPARAADRAAIERLHALARAADGQGALGDSVWRDLDTPAGDSAGFVARDPGDPGDEPIGFVHVARGETAAADEWSLGLVVAPGHRDGPVATELLGAALDHVSRRGGGRCTLWLPGPSAFDDTVVQSCGFSPTRELVLMRVALPLAEQPAWPAGTTLRSFEPGRDEEAWLAANNRAFAGHPEQGDWTLATLRRRMAEPWFDPALFLLALDDQGLAGFDWLKIHDACDEAGSADARCGEIYVIGVDPSRQGRGLGRALALAGLARLADRGIRTGILYVDRENDAARALYRALGFDDHRVDRAYERDVGPSEAR